MKAKSTEEFAAAATKLLSEGHTVSFYPRGDSMRPLLHGGRDRITLRAAAEYQRGDVVLAKTQAGKWVVHRVIRINGKEVTLLGDNNITPEYCLQENIHGRITAICRDGAARPLPKDSIKWKAYTYIWLHIRPTIVGLLRNAAAAFGKARD